MSGGTGRGNLTLLDGEREPVQTAASPQQSHASPVSPPTVRSLSCEIFKEGTENLRVAPPSIDSVVPPRWTLWILRGHEESRAGAGAGAGGAQQSRAEQSRAEQSRTGKRSIFGLDLGHQLLVDDVLEIRLHPPPVRLGLVDLDSPLASPPSSPPAASQTPKTVSEEAPRRWASP